MNCLFSYCRRILCLYLLFPVGYVFAATPKWTTPTAEELTMTEQKGAPNAELVYLDREEITDDREETFTFYNRIKLLSDKRKDRAKVELRYFVQANGKGTAIASFSGRTIHADGTVLLMTEEPTEEVVFQGPDSKTIKRTYKLPAPEAGSILEYRYTFRLDQHVEAPSWNIQTEFFTRKGHWEWLTGDQRLTQNAKGEQSRSIDSVRWTSLLPNGVHVMRKSNEGNGRQNELVVDVVDIPPVPKEERMPPTSSFAYNVRFYYSYSTQEGFWRDAGVRWSDAENHFIGPGPGVKLAVAKMLNAGDTPEQKLRKFYAAVMLLDNTSTEREQGVPHRPQVGQVPLKSADEVLAAGRGSNDQLNSLFIAMARSAGITAYVMRVSDRDRSIFNPTDMTMSQLTDNITIARVDGKELFLDPGTRFCPFGHLGWRHANAKGLRQNSGQPEFATALFEPVGANQAQRVANLELDEQGVATGTIKLTYVGTAGIFWRQLEAAKGDVAFREQVQKNLKAVLPAGMDINILSIDKLKEYEEPLVVMADVKGALGTNDGTRIEVKTDIFQAGREQSFKPEVREEPVYFNLGGTIVDAIRINFPASISVASPPVKNVETYQNAVSYELSTESTSTSVTIRRNFALGRLSYTLSEYPELRSFYTKVNSEDHALIVLKRPAAAGGD
jgi:hypothetical protein